MGASASASLDDVACCHNDRDDQDFVNNPSAPLRAVASDEVVRPEGERPMIKALSDKSAAAHPRLGGADMQVKPVSRDKPEPSMKSRSRSHFSLAEQAVDEKGESAESSAEVGDARPDDDETLTPEVLPADHPQRRASRASQKSVTSELNWKKPKEVARAAMKYMGLFSTGSAPAPEVTPRGTAFAPEQFAVELIELALAVCTASAGDCTALARVATRDDRRALRRLSDFARRNNLLQEGNMLFSGSLTMKELAHAFLESGGVDATHKRNKMSQAGRSRSDLTVSSAIATLCSEKEPSVHRTPPKSNGGSTGEALTLSDLAAREGGERSKLMRGGSNLSHLSRHSFMTRNQSKSSSSLMLPAVGPTYSRTRSDLSCTSFTDFNQRMRSKQAIAEDSEAVPSLMEYLSTLTRGANGDVDLAQTSNGLTSMVMDIQLPRSPTMAHAAQHSMAGAALGTASWSSEGAMTYHSATDAVLQGEGEEKEVVQAEVLNIAGDENNSRMRIAFRSRCLRTQNEWQRHLLQQQRSLLKIAKQRKEAAEMQLRQDEEVKEEQKELLRGFRKIIQRELCSTEEVHRATIFVVEREDELRNEVEGLCRIMKYPCQGFRHLASAEKSIQHSELSAIPSRRPSNNTVVGDAPPLLLEGRPGDDGQDWRVSSFVGPRSPASPNSSILDDSPLRIVLLGSQWLDRKLPEYWKEDENITMVLTSEAEEFEDVGRKLLASGEAEIRERLRERGISDYLLHPLSLESLQGVISKAIHKRFGDEYLLVGAVGRGNSGIVHEAKRLRDSVAFALKEIPTGRLSSSAKRDVEQEVQLLQELRWPTVVFVVDAWENQQARLRFLLMPLLKGGNLLQCIESTRKSGEKFSRDSVAAWYAQTLHGLTYLHWRGVLHRDVKPGNLFLAENLEGLQIGDLGSAALMPGPGPHPAKRTVVRGNVTTPSYSAPEVWSERGFMAGSDIWAVGVSFYEVMTLQTLFTGETSSKMEEAVCAFDVERPDSSPGRNIARQALAALRDSSMGAPAAELAELLRQDPLRRPMAAALVKRPATSHRLKIVLAKWALTGEGEEKQAHFSSFERTVSESEKAFDLPGQTQEEPECPKSRRARKRQERTSSSLSMGGALNHLTSDRSDF